MTKPCDNIQHQVVALVAPFPISLGHFLFRRSQTKYCGLVGARTDWGDTEQWFYIFRHDLQHTFVGVGGTPITDANWRRLYRTTELLGGQTATNTVLWLSFPTGGLRLTKHHWTTGSGTTTLTMILAYQSIRKWSTETDTNGWASK